MKTAVIEIEGIAPYSASAQHSTPHIEGEDHDTYDKRTWREKAHVHADGRVYIPGISLAKGLVSTAMQLGDKVPGRGAKRWGSVFKSGLMSPSPIDLLQPPESRVVTSDVTPNKGWKPILKDELQYVDVFCDATPGKPSGGRVWRRFPIVHQWSGTATILVINDTITEAVLMRHLELCGQINGLGRWSPRASGEFGRFKVLDLLWQDEAKTRKAA